MFTWCRRSIRPFRWARPPTSCRRCAFLPPLSLQSPSCKLQKRKKKRKVQFQFRPQRGVPFRWRTFDEIVATSGVQLEAIMFIPVHHFSNLHLHKRRKKKLLTFCNWKKWSSHALKVTRSQWVNNDGTWGFRLTWMLHIWQKFVRAAPLLCVRAFKNKSNYPAPFFLKSFLVCLPFYSVPRRGKRNGVTPHRFNPVTLFTKEEEK